MPTNLLLRLFACLVLPSSFVLSQDAPPSDPFVKEKGVKKAPTGAIPGDGQQPPLPVGPPPANLLFTFETYTLPQDALSALLADAQSAQSIYQGVQKVQSEGKARLDSLISLPTRSGQRALSESVDEVIYPTKFASSIPGRSLCAPVAFEMRPTGHRIELDPVVGPDESRVDLNLAPEFTRLAGFVIHRADELSPGQLQPLFTTRKTTTSVSCPMNVPTMLGTMSRPAQTGIVDVDGAGSVSVTFVIPRMSGPSNPPPSAEPRSNPDSANITMVYRFCSLPREKARDLLASTSDPDKLHELARALPDQEYKLERLITMKTRSGNRATVEEIGENIYGTEVDEPRSEKEKRKDSAPAPAAAASPGPASSAGRPEAQSTPEVLPGRFTALEMRPVGWRIEVDPVLERDGTTIYLNLAPEHVEHRGNLQGHDLLTQYPEQPVFSSQKITTAVAAQVGSQCFLGTMNAPHDTGVNGRTDDGRVWFGFVRVTLE